MRRSLVLACFLRPQIACLQRLTINPAHVTLVTADFTKVLENPPIIIDRFRPALVA
jgi:hypothetical protein